MSNCKQLEVMISSSKQSYKIYICSDPSSSTLFAGSNHHFELLNKLIKRLFCYRFLLLFLAYLAVSR